MPVGLIRLKNGSDRQEERAGSRTLPASGLSPGDVLGHRQANKKAIYNLKLLNGVPTLAGPSIDLGAEEKYLPACNNCYWKKLNGTTQTRHDP